MATNLWSFPDNHYLFFIYLLLNCFIGRFSYLCRLSFLLPLLIILSYLRKFLFLILLFNICFWAFSWWLNISDHFFIHWSPSVQRFWLYLDRHKLNLLSCFFSTMSEPNTLNYYINSLEYLLLLEINLHHSLSIYPWLLTQYV